jgi:hypothetical protein
MDPYGDESEKGEIETGTEPSVPSIVYLSWTVYREFCSEPMFDRGFEYLLASCNAYGHLGQPGEPKACYILFRLKTRYSTIILIYSYCVITLCFGYFLSFYLTCCQTSQLHLPSFHRMCSLEESYNMKKKRKFVKL